MGSGCLNLPISNNCGTPTSSNCVRYMGEPVPAFGICTGDTITEVESTIIAQIQGLLSGTGININQVTLDNCPYLLNMFAGKNKSIANLIQLLVDSTCTLKALIDNINTMLAPSNFVFNLKCLPPVTNPTQEKILQQLINSFCDLSTTVNNIVESGGDTTIINDSINTALSNLIGSAGGKGIKKSTTPDGLSSYYFTGLMLPNLAGLYFGSLNVFDSTGLGLPGTVAEGYAICNGINQTPDMRGFAGVGAIQGIPGPALDSLVDPVANADNSMNYAIGSKGGRASITLNVSHLPPHSHPVIDPKHFHNSNVLTYQQRVQGGNGYVLSTTAQDYNQSTVNIETDLQATNITIGNTGSGAPIENRMPFKAGVWVMRINN